MEQTSFQIPIDHYLVEHFSANQCCEERERQRLEQKYAKQLEVSEAFNRQSVSYQLSKNDPLIWSTYSWMKWGQPLGIL